jgi:hypothetical protein
MRTQATSLGPLSYGMAASLALATVLTTVSGPALADAPVSVGTRGAIQRAALTQTQSRKGSAATFGTPAFDESRGFGFKLRIPLFLSGAEEGEAASTVPYAVNPATKVPGTTGFLGTTGTLATEDFRKIQSYIPAIEIGEERKAFHLQLGALSQRQGHGTLVHWFTNSPEGAERRMGILVEANSASLGGQVMVGDIFSPGSFASARVYGRPILWFLAPDSLIHPNDLDLDPRTELAGIWVSGLQVAIDGYAPMTAGVDDDDFGMVYAAGWDNELALLDNKLIKAMGYLDLNMLGGPRAGLDTPVLSLPFGVGAHPGIRADLELPVAIDLNIEAEGNIGSRGYVPRYFDRLYFIERTQTFGTAQTKAALAAPASFGFNLRASANIAKTVSLFLEARDQFPFNPNEGSNAGAVTAGASLFFLFFGGSVTMSQAGIRDYTNFGGLMGPGWVFTAEGRVALLANIIHIVGRYYRVHDPVDINLIDREFNVIEGTMVGLEINFDLNTPFPFF